jgi:hypothetical protein
LKKNIRALNPVLDKALRLKPSMYQFNNNDGHDDTLEFIAQDVQNYFSEIVNEKNGIRALAYDKFSVLAIKAIQE